jgi:hypothetical protein
MYMGPKIYSIMENDIHQTLNAPFVSLNHKPRFYFIFLFYCLDRSQLWNLVLILRSFL